MEKDGLVIHTIYREVRPRVEYLVTKFGYALGEAFRSIWKWAVKNYKEVEGCGSKITKK